jgi:hypothetical protein
LTSLKKLIATFRGAAIQAALTWCRHWFGTAVTRHLSAQALCRFRAGSSKFREWMLIF